MRRSSKRRRCDGLKPGVEHCGTPGLQSQTNPTPGKGWRKRHYLLPTRTVSMSPSPLGRGLFLRLPYPEFRFAALRALLRRAAGTLSVPEKPLRLLLGARQHLGRVDVLPPGVLNIDRPRLPFFRHESHPLRQTAVVVFERPAQLIEHALRAEKNSRIDRVIRFKLLADRDDHLVLGPHFHRVIQIEDRPDFS